MRKAAPFVVGVTLAHAALSFGVFMLDFGMGMARFDSGESRTVIEAMLNTLSTILLLPIFYGVIRLKMNIFPGLLGYIPLFANSLVWGIGIWLLYRQVVKRNEGRRA